MAAEAIANRRALTLPVMSAASVAGNGTRTVVNSVHFAFDLFNSGVSSNLKRHGVT